MTSLRTNLFFVLSVFLVSLGAEAQNLIPAKAARNSVASSLSLAAAITPSSDQDSWSEMIDSRGTWVLAQEVQHSSGFVVKKGEKFWLKDFFGTEDFVVLELLNQNCTDPSFFSDEIDIITPEGEPYSSAVGLRPIRNCRLEIFVETKNYYDHSLFKGQKENEK